MKTFSVSSAAELRSNDCRALRGSLASLLAEGYRAKRMLDAVRAAAVSGTREARQSLGRKERSGLRPNGLQIAEGRI